MSEFERKTLSRIEESKKQGRGLGRDEAYLPWIRIRRKLSSPVSNLHCLRIPRSLRPIHLLSGLEMQACLVLAWLGVREIREQMPLWPDPHAHPAGGRHPELSRRHSTVAGLRAIADDIGIKHGTYPGTGIPFVATIDFMIDVGTWHDTKLVLWSVKPWDLLARQASCRLWERIELERAYARAVDASHVVIDGRQFTRQFTENLDWLQPLPSQWKSFSQNKRLDDFAGHFDCLADSYPVATAVQAAGEKLGLDLPQAHSHFRAAAWGGMIDIDIESPIVLTGHVKRGGNARERLSGLLHREAA